MNEQDLEKLLAGVAPEGVRKALEETLAAIQADLRQDLGQLATELGELGAASQAQGSAVRENTLAVWENTAAQTNSGSGSAPVSAGKTIWKVLGSGLSLSPLWKGVAGLFRGSQPQDEVPLAAYVPPPAVRLEGEISRSRGEEQYAWEWEQLVRRPRETRPAAQITVQVQAMDSRSFLDHSEEIARAVREAMLHSHSLNDVVSEV